PGPARCWPVRQRLIAKLPPRHARRRASNFSIRGGSRSGRDQSVAALGRKNCKNPDPFDKYRTWLIKVAMLAIDRPPSYAWVEPVAGAFTNCGAIARCVH